MGISEDEFLWSDIEGQQVVDSQGVEVGVIDIIHNQGASDLARIKSKEFGVLEIPLIEHYFDMDFKTESVQLVVTIDTFEGLWSKK